MKVVREEMFIEENGDRPEVKNIVVMLTDGLDNVRARQTLHEARYARASGMYLVPVGIAVTDRRGFHELATDDQNGLFFVDNFRLLSNLTDGLIEYVTEGMASDAV